VHAGSTQQSTVTARSPEPRVDTGLVAICGLAVASGLIHVRAAIDHFDVSQLEGMLFLLTANAQLLWAILAYKSATPRLLWAGAVVSVGIALVWAVSRTSGIPFGPHPWVPEAVGMIDLLATLDELVLALAVVARWLRASASSARAMHASVNGASVALMLLSSLELGGVTHHVH
jgi:hypothetical protein